MHIRHITTGLILGVALLAGCGTPEGTPVRVIIPRHTSFRVAAESLAKAGIMRSAFVFRLYARRPV